MTNQKRRAGNFLLLFTVSLHSLIRLAKSHPTMNTSPWRGYVLQLLILSLARWRAKSEGCILASCKGRSRWQCINNNHWAYFLSFCFCFFVFFKIRSMPSAPLTFRVDDKGHIVPERRWRLAFPLLDHIFRSFDFWFSNCNGIFYSSLVAGGWGRRVVKAPYATLIDFR